MEHPLRSRDWCAQRVAVLCEGQRGRLSLVLSMCLADLELGALNRIVLELEGTKLEGLDLLDDLVDALRWERFQQ